MNNIVLSHINSDRTDINVKDTKLKQKLDLLINNICIQRLEKNKYCFFKYFASTRKGIMYLLILSGDVLDGLYEFEIFGHQLKFIQRTKEIGEVLEVRTSTNYAQACFDVKDVTTIIKNNEPFEFVKDVQQFFLNLINFDIISIKNFNNEEIIYKQNLLGEISFKKEVKAYIKNNINNLKEIAGTEKKKKICITQLNLGKAEFEKQITELELVSKSEYDFFTSLDDDKFQKFRKEHECLLVDIL